MALEAAEKGSNNDSAERGGAGGRGNADFTAFVSNLPFNITADELREKFKHVSFSVCHFYPFCVSLSPLLCVTVCHLYIGCHWLQCGDITDIRLAQKHIRGRACKFGYVEFQSKVSSYYAII